MPAIEGKPGKEGTRPCHQAGIFSLAVGINKRPLAQGFSPGVNGSDALIASWLCSWESFSLHLLTEPYLSPPDRLSMGQFME
jgi:hypothetical protein